MKLLDTNGGNPKLNKSGIEHKYRVAGLSLFPDDQLCPMRHKAECAAPCLVNQGRGQMNSVMVARQRKSAWFKADYAGFMHALTDEITRFEKTCKRQGVLPAIRLNVFSDIPWERHGIIERFPNVMFYDYTKLATRIGKTPDNYKLIFSYSSAKAYKPQVTKALKTDAPISVVFRGDMPATFLGRTVINGDADDLVNAFSGPVIVGLKEKGKDQSNSALIIKVA